MSVKKISGLAVVFVVFLLVFAIALLPASVALEWFKKDLPPGLQLGPATGTIWQGQVHGVRYQGQYVSTVRWQVQPLALLQAKLNTDLVLGNKRNANELSAQGQLVYGLFNKELQLHDAQARLSLEQVLQRVRLPIPTEAKGRVFVELDNYQLGEPHCQALAGTISSADINVKGRNGWFSIGELEGELGCVNGAAKVTVTKENRLGLQVDAGFDERGQFSVNGFIKPDASLPKDVHDAVQFLGAQGADGRYRINF
ncbi:type II secretion system protein N [Pseudoalteromonas sp. BDTF-M6]|uniref:type II secretion system protein N n=1 Tax=Pseudoalteromonas sp. BDTF-M6 TaxID=2796132 RepID=UPI001BB03A49|nr:type II secretion system protein N [Pseudoalteromonas sp. BDTF-M6]MBS3797234.1 type II secretion system protein N [Pseudoalteromonas sp. BDTF-M6]